VEIKLKSYYERHRSKFIPVDPKSDTLFKDQQQADFEKVFKEALTGLCDAALQNRVKPVLLWLPSLDELGATNAPSVLATKRELSRTRGVVLAEPIPTGLPDPKALYLPDDPVHFNTRGNEIIAARVAESVTSPAAP
jgi:hypothetical protein